MFKKAKRKIVISILAILLAVLIGTLGMIYVSSYLSLSSQNFQILESHAQTVALGMGGFHSIDPNDKSPNPFGPSGNGKNNGEKLQHRLDVNTFYSVAISNDGSSTVLENGANNYYSDEDLTALAKSVISNEKGRTGNLIYRTDKYDNVTIVCFMDNTVYSDSFSQLFLYTLLFGVIAIVIIAFISIRIADRIVSPMEENYQKQKQFTADAGHELKTPIAAMAANIELLFREVGENKWLDNISYENQRMQDLVTELLELARNENKVAERTSTDLSHLVNGVILPLEASAFEKNILIASDIPDGIISNIDSKSVTQLVTTLVDNAISHTKNNSDQPEKVYIKLSESKGHARLTISNPGPEIPKAEREKLFERFYRTDSSHEFTGHYGLGLAIAKAIAEANHATISIDCRDGLVIFDVLFPEK